MTGGLRDLVASADEARLIRVEAEPSLRGYKDYAAWIARLHAALSPIQAQKQWRISLTGSPAFGAEIGQGMEQDMAGTSGICGALVVLLFLWFQRSWRQLLAIVISLTLVLALTLGCYGWCFGELGMMSAGFAAILMGLAVDYAMIITRELPLTNGDAQRASQLCRPGILWGALTTAAPFSVLLSSAMPGVGQLGFLVSVGLLFGAVIMLWLYPTLAFRKGETLGSTLDLGLRCLSPKLARVSFAVLTIACVSFIAWRGQSTDLSFDLAMLRPKESLAMQALERVQQRFPSWGEALIHIIVDDPSLARQTATNAATAVAAMQTGQLASAAWVPSGVLPHQGDFQGNLVRLNNANLLPPLRSALDRAGYTNKASALAESLLSHWQRWQQMTAAAAFAEVSGHPLLKSCLLPADASHRLAVIGGVRLRLLRGRCCASI
jgi:uncharacterized protein